MEEPLDPKEVIIACQKRNTIFVERGGGARAPRYRSRLVCTKVRHKGIESIFSATPYMSDCRTKTQSQRSTCGRQRQAMYGSFAHRCGEHYTKSLETEGFFPRRDFSVPFFFHEGLHTYILVHCDDVFIVGRREERKQTPSLLQSAYEPKQSRKRGTGKNIDIATAAN